MDGGADDRYRAMGARILGTAAAVAVAGSLVVGSLAARVATTASTTAVASAIATTVVGR